MPNLRNKVPSVRLEGLISEKFQDQDVVEWIGKMKASMGQATLLREAVDAFYKLKHGKLIDVEVLKNIQVSADPITEPEPAPEERREEESELVPISLGDAMDVWEDFE